jgi:hypothetical protein
MAGVGLGDSVAELTHITGVDKLAKYYEQATGKSCGCEERRELLNNLFPFPQQSAEHAPEYFNSLSFPGWTSQLIPQWMSEQLATRLPTQLQRAELEREGPGRDRSE